MGGCYFAGEATEIGTSSENASRAKRGDESAAKLMSGSGPLAGIPGLFAIRLAVITFN
jgi:hypothetical protein